MQPKKDDLWILPLGGLEQVGANCTMIGNNGEWIIIDLGIAFYDKFGVEILTPDITFPMSVRENLKGIFVTHAHEDHIGAIPYLWQRLRCPIYASEFTAAVLRQKLKECEFRDEVEVHVMPLKTSVGVGDNFKIEYVPLAHSILGACGVYVKTPAGTVFHTGDWKLDDAPLLGDKTDEKRLAEIGKEGVDCLLCDSTNSAIDEETISESVVRDALGKLAESYKDKRIVITCFASNVARLETVFQIARKLKRKVGLVGRSMHRIIDAVSETSYCSDALKSGLATIISDEEAASLSPSQVILLCTGSQGETRSALCKLSRGENRLIKLGKHDIVLFSSKVIPGNELAIREMQNLLVHNGVEIITQEMVRNIHVSGHPNRQALMKMYGWLKPRTFVPIHGDSVMLHNHIAFAEQNGIKETLIADSGDLISVSGGTLKKINRIDVMFNAVDGPDLIPIQSQAIRDREIMSYNGHVSISLVLQADQSGHSKLKWYDIVVNGIHIDEENYHKLHNMSRQIIANEVSRGARNMKKDCSIAIKKLINKHFEKKPIVAVHVHRV